MQREPVNFGIRSPSEWRCQLLDTASRRPEQPTTRRIKKIQTVQKGMQTMKQQLAMFAMRPPMSPAPVLMYAPPPKHQYQQPWTNKNKENHGGGGGGYVNRSNCARKKILWSVLKTTSIPIHVHMMLRMTAPAQPTTHQGTITIAMPLNKTWWAEPRRVPTKWQCLVRPADSSITIGRKRVLSLLLAETILLLTQFIM